MRAGRHHDGLTGLNAARQDELGEQGSDMLHALLLQRGLSSIPSCSDGGLGTVMTASVYDALEQLLNTFGRVTPPVDPTVLKSLYRRKDYASMLGWIKNSLKLDLRVGLRIVNASGPSPPMWIEIPRPLPPFGTAEFRRTRVVVNVRRDLIETKPFAWVVAGFAHELCHVVLFSIGHPLQHEEKAVDLTAMILGYQSFVADAEVTRTEGAWLSALLMLILAPLGIFFWRGTSKRTQRLGYLTTAEADFARQHLAGILDNR